MDPSNEKFWGALGCLLALTLYGLSPLALGGANPQLALAIAGIVSSMSFGLLACSLALLTRGPHEINRKLGFPQGIARGTLHPATLVALCVGMLALSYATDAALELTGLRDASSLQNFDQTLRGARGGALAALLLGIGIAPGIGEELLFRGFLQNAFQVKLGRVTALFLSAFLFGVMHFDLAHSMGAFALGLYLGIALLLDQSLRAPLLCHIVNNSCVVLVVALTPPEQKENPSAAMMWLALSLALATLIGVTYVARRTSLAAFAHDTESAERLS